jgi:hypothetical protein
VLGTSGISLCENRSWAVLFPHRRFVVQPVVDRPVLVVRAADHRHRVQGELVRSVRRRYPSLSLPVFFPGLWLACGGGR